MTTAKGSQLWPAHFAKVYTRFKQKQQYQYLVAGNVADVGSLVTKGLS